MNHRKLKAKSEQEGKTYETNSSGVVKIIEYNSKTHVTVKFLNTGNLKVTTMASVRKGTVKDVLAMVVHGVGYSQGVRDTKGNKAYQKWVGMLGRCYCENTQEKQPTYVGCFVSDYFKQFNNFEKWCEVQVGFCDKDERGNYFALDKDILGKDNKLYSEDTCVFVPQEINNCLLGNASTIVSAIPRSSKFRVRLSKFGVRVHLGMYETKEEAILVYKQAKEDYLKELAEKWKDQIDPRAYEALMKYQVEVTD